MDCSVLGGSSVSQEWQERIQLHPYRDLMPWQPLPKAPAGFGDRKPAAPRGISTAAYAPEEQFEAWRCHVAPFMDVGLPPGTAPADGFLAEFMICSLGGIGVASGRADAFSFSHAPGHSAPEPRRAPIGCWRLMLMTEGEMWVESSDRHAHVRPGDLFLLSLDAAFRGRGTRQAGLCLTLPRDAFAAAAAGFDRASGAVLTGPLAALLVDYLRSLEVRLVGMTPDDLMQAGRATAEMLAACIRPSRDPLEEAQSTVASVLFDRARSYIQAHFGNPELTPERVAQDLRVSRSNLYRVFERAGGVSRYIQQCRLFAAHAALSSESGRRIQDIAYGCGFKLASDFTRAFKREFGYSPREARGIRRTRAEPMPPRPAVIADSDLVPIPAPAE